MAGLPCAKHGEQEPHAIQAELARILASGTFARADRLSRFLQFVVVAVVEGRGEDLKEYSIALEVFDRPVSYDPQIDSLVRVEASRLRARLKQYYDTEGQDDPIRIDIPKGSYAPVFEERSQPATEHRAPIWRRRGIILVAAVAIIAIVWLASGLRTRLHKPEAPFSLAVLPFTDLSSAKDQEYFCDGLTEELINVLSGTEGLRVTSRTSTNQFRGKAIDVRTIAKQLNVRAVIEGSVRKEGSQVRITVHAFNGADGYQLWAATYERELNEIFTLQQEVAKAIVDRLHISPQGARPQRAARPRPKTLEAYHDYLKARHFRGYGSPDAILKGIEHFKLAIAADPGYALARAGLAEAYARLARTEVVPPQEVMPEAMMQALKAVELDASIPESHHALGTVKILSGWDWNGAEREFRAAIAIDPGFEDARFSYAHMVLNPRGRHREAIEHLQAALELDPVSGTVNTELGNTRKYLFQSRRGRPGHQSVPQDPRILSAIAGRSDTPGCGSRLPV